MSDFREKIRIGIVDDDLLVVQLLCDFFNSLRHMEVCLTAQGGEEFLEKIESLHPLPDILLLDLRMKKGNGLDTLKHLQEQACEIKTIVLTSFYSDSFTGQMLKLNAAAFLPKDISRSELVLVIETVLEQGYYFSAEQMNTLRLQISGKIPQIRLTQENVLSDREREVLVLVCHQCTTQEIAEALFVSPKTIESHKSNLLVKTGAKNMAGLVMYAVQHNIVNPNQMIQLNR